MCGFAGIARRTGVAREEVEAMAGAIAHRGPDDHDAWISSDGSLGLAHRRLSVIDTGPAGRQPMASSDGRFRIVFNGEIYNYRELRDELGARGVRFRTASDTEVLLEAYRAWGAGCLEKLDGMFAFALWDDAGRELFVARDHVGEKPFKYFHDGATFAFASEVKAILALPEVPREADFEAIDLAMGLRFVPSPLTGFRGIKKLPAGHYGIFKDGGFSLTRYWQPPQPAAEPGRTTGEWAAEAWRLFAASAKRRLVSDIPVGAFLSGGLDSTSVVAAMREAVPGPIDTYAVILGGTNEDGGYARRAAAALGTRHREIALGDLDFPAELAGYAASYDEPFFDQSGIVTCAVSREMKRSVSVVLGGDGGDELFGGYPAYRFAGTLARYGAVPAPMRRGISRLAGAISGKWGYRAEIMAKDFHAAYADYFSVWQSALPASRRYLTKADLYLPSLRAATAPDATARLFKGWFGSSLAEPENGAMRADFMGRLPDGYCAKVDIASMSSGLEVRSPFLDRRLVEFAARIPASVKMEAGEGKAVWKNAVRGRIPDEILTRRKEGFAFPLDMLLGTKLRPAAEAALLSDSARVRRYFDPAAMRRLWADHLAWRADYSNHIWAIVALEAWLTQWNAR